MAGMRLPLPNVGRFCGSCCMSPRQIAPNAWRKVVWFVAYARSRVEASLDPSWCFAAMQGVGVLKDFIALDFWKGSTPARKGGPSHLEGVIGRPFPLQNSMPFEMMEKAFGAAKRESEAAKKELEGEDGPGPIYQKRSATPLQAAEGIGHFSAITVEVLSSSKPDAPGER